MSTSSASTRTKAPGPPPRDAHEGRDFLAGGGDMGERIRALDWASTPLGPPEAWPQGLKTVARLMLTTRHPMFIFWGDDSVGLYNDAYRASLGPEKHPSILGAAGRTAWPEIWDVIGPQIALVLRGEGATWHENQLVPIIRHGGLQDVYWTYSFGPIDEPGAPTGVGGVLVVCTETTQQVLAERRRGEEIERLRAMFTQAPGFICILQGPEHVFELANAAYARMVGGRDVVGKRVRDAFPEMESQGFLELLNRVYTTGEPYIGRAQRIVFQPSPLDPPDERFLDFVYQPIRDGSGEITGIFCEGADVSERVRAEEEREALLGTLAHDLKTPLSALKAQAQLLHRRIARQGVPDADSLMSRVALFDELASRMAEQIDELGDHARLVVGHPVEIERRPTDLVALTEDAIAEVWQAGGPHEIRLDHDAPTLVGEWDPRRLRRIVSNLLGNAVKYSPEGGDITVRVSEEAGEAVLEVRDAGIGIPAGDLPHVFAFRHRGANVGAIAGSGIGLAGAQRIVEEHDGSISVASDEGRGSTFTVRLPFRP